MGIRVKLKFSCFFYHSKDALPISNAISLIQKLITSFAQDMIYNYIDDFKIKLESNTGIGALPCTKYMHKIYAQSDIESRRSPQKVLYQNIDSYYLQRRNDLKPMYQARHL